MATAHYSGSSFSPAPWQFIIDFNAAFFAAHKTGFAVENVDRIAPDISGSFAAADLYAAFRSGGSVFFAANFARHDNVIERLRSSPT